MTTQQQIRDAIKARLSKIAAGRGGRAFTPDAVVTYSQFPDVPLVESSFRTIYGIRPIREEEQFKKPDTCYVTCDLTLAVAMWRRLESADESPYVAGPDRWDMQAEMARDISQQIVEDMTFEGHAQWVTGMSTDYERYLPEWACAEATFTVRYLYDVGAR